MEKYIIEREQIVSIDGQQVMLERGDTITKNNFREETTNKTEIEVTQDTDTPILLNGVPDFLDLKKGDTITVLGKADGGGCVCVLKFINNNNNDSDKINEENSSNDKKKSDKDYPEDPIYLYMINVKNKDVKDNEFKPYGSPFNNEQKAKNKKSELEHDLDNRDKDYEIQKLKK